MVSVTIILVQVLKGENMDSVKKMKHLNFYLTEDDWSVLRKWRFKNEDERTLSAIIRDMIKEKIYET